MTYRALSEHLHQTANSAMKYFKKEFGLKSPKIEEEIDKNVEYRPTFHGVMDDKTVLCVEVAENPSSPELLGFILSCKNHSFPACVWVAIPKGVVIQLSIKQLAFSKENGIGIVEIDDNGLGRQLTSTPLSLSLTGLRAPKYSEYPAKYRATLKSAYETFCGGNPSKGCAVLYDEIENICRRILKKCASKNFLKNGVQPNFDIDTANWSTILEYSKTHIDIVQAACPELKLVLFNRLLGITGYRNESGHKPSSTGKLIARDKQLRTRFEGAQDELQILIKASSGLRV